MKKLRFLELLYGALDYYYQGDPKGAYDYLTNNQNRVEGSVAGISYYRFLFACEMKDKKVALDILKEAVDDLDFWFPYSSVGHNEIRQLFTEDETYLRLIELCKIREAKRKFSGNPAIDVFEPKEASLDNPKLLIALHGDQQEIDSVYDYWNPKTYFNHIVAIPQASEVAYTDGHAWTTIDRGVKELKTHYDQLVSKYHLENENITLCSFSGGTAVALEAVVKNYIQVGKLIFVAPPLQNLEVLKNDLMMLKENNISVYILCGDSDDRFLPVAQKFAEYLKNVGVNYKLHIAENTKHEYPKNFEEILLEIKVFFKYE
ncbi:MAG: hypothetical protein CVV56_06010 [Tenericutes bacterium HGW-Tenericutes-1]|jgi:predicted esterase|nr:MAG: hypothetical protein CVV56_06010 [Tenericutes bacterium HGW-Tenericutes-1]